MKWIKTTAKQPPTETPVGHYELPKTLARLLYTFVKIRGYKVISRFFPNEPYLLEPVYALFASLESLVQDCWELRFILLLWLSHLLLAPFDLSTISSDEDSSNELDGTVLDLPNLPSLSKRLLALGKKYISSPGNRENDAATVLLIRISLRRDMREIGLLDAMVEWGSEIISRKAEETKLVVFLKTGVLAVLAGFLAKGDPTAVRKHVPGIYSLVQQMHDNETEEWESSGIRRLGMKVYRWVARLSLDGHGEEEFIEDIIERLLNALGDRDTAVRFGASKSLAVVSKKLDPEMASDVLEAVMAIYDEDVFLEPAVPTEFVKQRKVYTAVAAEKWHGATLTLATFLRQRAVRSTEVLQHALGCMVQALNFEQRRSTFAIGGNVRDAACYAAWSLARSYTTAELTAGGPIPMPTTAIDTDRSMLQILATELVVAACLDPLGNVRRASSAALQELVGRHQNNITRGIELVQAVDYSAVALRRRSVIDVASHAAVLDDEYWRAIVFGIAEGWRGIGSSDDDGRLLAAKSLGALMQLGDEGKSDAWLKDRFSEVFGTILRRLETEGKKQSDIYHGSLWGLAEILEPCQKRQSPLRDVEDEALRSTVFARLTGREFLNPVFNPELIAESTSRLVRALANRVRSNLLSVDAHALRVWTAILEASLYQAKDNVLEEAVAATEPLLLALSESNRRNMVVGWCDRILDAQYRRRGHVLALGAVASRVFHDDPEILSRITDALLSAAVRKNEVELRSTGVKALAEGILAGGIVTSHTDQVLSTINVSLDDYTVDTRGDVGSLVRAEAVSAVVCIGRERSKYFAENSLPAWQELVGKVVRMTVEKLDRLRIAASTALMTIEGEPSISALSSALPAALITSSSHEYFATLIPLLHDPTYRSFLLEGLVTSASVGSDTVLRSSRRALIDYLMSPSASASFSQTFLSVFRAALTSTNDRVVAPALDVAALLLDLDLLQLDAKQTNSMLVLTQKAHYKSASIPKLSNAVRVYGSLGLIEREKVAGVRLCALLKHPWPRMRVEAADALYLLGQEMGMGLEGLGKVDWAQKLEAGVVEGVVADWEKVF